MKNWWLYTLKLEHGKYYVGITTQTPEKRFLQHKNKYLAANWTKMYPPIEIMQTKYLGAHTQEQAELFEARVTREYIKKYGLRNVRGGDMTYVGEYFKRFGGYFQDNGWETITVVSFLSLGFLILTVLFILK